jgi:hypothetical protein
LEKKTEQVLPGSGGLGGRGRGRQVAQPMYIHVSKSKNDKIKGQRKNKKSEGIKRERYVDYVIKNLR